MEASKDANGNPLIREKAATKVYHWREANLWILSFQVHNIISLAGVVVMKLHKHKSMDSVLRNILPSGEYLQEKSYVSAHAFHDLIS